MRGVLVMLGIGICFVVVAVSWVAWAITSDNRTALKPAPAAGGDESKPLLHNFKVQDIDGRDVELSRYRGQALLIVNTASRCGFTPQYASLEKLHEKYRDRGFTVLAFPANNFMGQEPGTNAEIKEFCALKFKTTFPLFSKISVKGDDIHPLYRYLTTQAGFNGDIGWNFTKFVVAPDGRVSARFGSRQDPLDPEVVAAVESVLPQNAAAAAAKA